MAKCSACGKFLSATGAATCTNCPYMYHKVCVALSDGGTVPKNWVCPECKKKIRKGDNSNTPVKCTTENSSPLALAVAPPEGLYHSEGTSFSSVVPEASEDNDYRAMRRELAECMSELRAFRNEMFEFRTCLGGLNQRLDVLEQRIDGLEQRNISSEIKGVSELEETITQLKLELNDRDQEALLSDLDIGCLPEQRGENVVHTIIVLGTKLGVKIEERDIVFAERVGALKPVSGDDTSAKGARRVVVRLTRRHIRDEMIRAARVRRNLTSTDMGIAGASQRVYINERLTRTNRLLFHRAREECRKRNWRYSWTKKGRVYIREGDGKRSYGVRSEADILRVFGSNTV
ncbi:hypothetical protein K1T71_014748 [Dendrolimus kikuchii]|nr:hypothetical protein K1T71_014748 [Dendrolimus kikuchii]